MEREHAELARSIARQAYSRITAERITSIACSKDTPEAQRWMDATFYGAIDELLGLPPEPVIAVRWGRPRASDGL